jgi:cyclopropane fatty-acyl-phospholipid synthase-like methyltransferase
MQTHVSPPLPCVQSTPDLGLTTYYDQTWFDYRALWLNSDNLAFHFGYHDHVHRTHQDALCNANRILADLAMVKPGDRVLDAGCGVGGSSFWLAQNRGTEVVGITLVQSQVERAHRIARARRVSDCVTFELADYCHTPFPRESFDVVWALESLCHAPRKEAFYIEAARLLRPGGRLIVAEYMRKDRDQGPTEERLIREWLDGWMIPDLATADEHRLAAVEACLTNVAVMDGTGLTRPALKRLYVSACLVLPFELVLYLCGLRTRVQHGNVVASLRQYQALRRDCWFYGILRGEKP